MKNKLIYSLILLSTVGMASCDEDFKDWADPQANEQLDATSQAVATVVAGKDNDIIVDRYNLTTDSVEILKVESMSTPEGSKAKVKELTINDNYTIPFIDNEGTVKVSVAQLDSITELMNKSRASVARDLKLSIKASALTPSGDGIQLDCNDVNIKLTPPTPPEIDPAGYYIVGDMSSWDKAGATAFTKEDNNIYTLELETTKDKVYFKIVPGKAIEGEALDWSYVMGSATDGDTSGDNFIVWNDPQAIMIPEKGKYKITFDMTNYRFTVKDNSAPSELFMTGSKYYWGGTWNELVPVNGVLGCFWGMYYFEENEEIKFAPQAAWGKDFGFSANTSKESIDRAGLSDAGGNIKVGKAGWYLIYINSKESERTVEFEEPIVYMIGDCAGSWDSFKDEYKFTSPTTADGVFTSQPFVNDGEMRMYVHPAEVGDWWRTEFIVINGKITYRGNDGDQERVKASKGQSITLDFTNGTGVLK